jgi:hypothetical protein
MGDWFEKVSMGALVDWAAARFGLSSGAVL